VLVPTLVRYRSRAPIGPQGLRYVAAVAVNFGVILVGVTTALAAMGVRYQLARVAAGGAEGIVMFSAMRWFVFTAAPSEDQDRAPVS
jgi:putative flippase GtrA